MVKHALLIMHQHWQLASLTSRAYKNTHKEFFDDVQK